MSRICVAEPASLLLLLLKFAASWLDRVGPTRCQRGKSIAVAVAELQRERQVAAVTVVSGVEDEVAAKELCRFRVDDVLVFVVLIFYLILIVAKKKKKKSTDCTPSYSLFIC